MHSSLIRFVFAYYYDIKVRKFHLPYSVMMFTMCVPFHSHGMDSLHIMNEGYIGFYKVPSLLW